MQDTSATQTRTAWLLASTPVVLLPTHYAAVLPHEFGHSFVAWFLGLKPNPLIIDWGGSSLLNILLLIDIDEHVDYTAALAAGKDWQVALVAFAGPGLANGGLYLLSRWFIKSAYVASRPFIAYVVFWFLYINLANLYDYVPTRVFASDGDVHHFLLGTGISPWVVYVLAGYLVLWAVVDFYRIVLPYTLGVCGFVAPAARAVVLIVATVLLFGYFDIPALEEADARSQLIARTSLLAIPVVIAMMWRRIVVADAPPRTSPAPVERAVPAYESS